MDTNVSTCMDTVQVQTHAHTLMCKHMHRYKQKKMHRYKSKTDTFCKSSVEGGWDKTNVKTSTKFQISNLSKKFRKSESLCAFPLETEMRPRVSSIRGMETGVRACMVHLYWCKHMHIHLLEGTILGQLC